MRDIREIGSLCGRGGGKPLVVAGPCSAESEEQVRATAASLSQLGVDVFRAGIWKARTHPGGFEGVGERGLSWLQAVKSATGMRVATEVANSAHVAAALAAGIDVLWIGARTSASPFATQEIADALRGHDEVTVLVKNPVNPDLELWIGALQRIYNAGITRLGAIHRGFTAYGSQLYRNEPRWHIAIELRRRLPELTILCDPSHMGGKRELVAPISQCAIDMGFDGLMIECHCAPEQARSDSAQQLTPAQLKTVLDSLVARSPQPLTDELQTLRLQIDQCDRELLNVLTRRMAVSRQIGVFKKAHNLQILQPERYDDIVRRLSEAGAQTGMSAEFMQTLMQVIHEESVRQQLRLYRPSQDESEQ